jgi:hypothetical protein
MKLARWLARIAAAVLSPPSSLTPARWPVRQSAPARVPLPPRPRVVMPPDPGRRPWPGPRCACGKTWTDTGQGWAAADRHNDLDLPACDEAARQHARDRAAIRRAIIRADPELSRQQREYNRAAETRRRPRRRQPAQFSNAGTNTADQAAGK